MPPKIKPLYKLWLEVEVTDDQEEYDHEEILEPYLLGYYHSAASLLIDMGKILQDMGELEQSNEIHLLKPKQVEQSAINMLKAQDAEEQS